MSFGGISFNRLKRLTSYEGCAMYYANTKAMRGSDKAIRGVPLREDRTQPDNYALHYRPADYSYALRLYSTDVVTYKRDGTVVIDATYRSNTTNDFATFYMPTGSNLSCRQREGHTVITDYLGYYPAGRTRLELVKTTAGKYVVNRESKAYPIPVMQVRRIDRTKTAAPRKFIAPFFAYLDTLCALTHETGFTSGAVKEMQGDGEWVDIRRMRLEDLQDETLWPRLATSNAYTRNRWVSGAGGGEYRGFIQEAAIKERVTDRAYETMGAYYMETLAVGVVHRDMRVKESNDE